MKNKHQFSQEEWRACLKVLEGLKGNHIFGILLKNDKTSNK